jgi:hypothetical protein
MWKEGFAHSKWYVKSGKHCLKKHSVASFKSLDWDIYVAIVGNILVFNFQFLFLACFP